MISIGWSARHLAVRKATAFRLACRSCSLVIMSGEEEFERWLRHKLQQLNTDHDTFGTYIRSIIEGDDSHDEKLEALEGILGEITETEAGQISNEILQKWALYKPQKPNGNDCASAVSAKLASIMEKQSQSVTSDKKVSEEERRLKDAILAQYSHISDSDDEQPKVVATTAKDDGATSKEQHVGVPKNTNAEDVLKAERDKKEKGRLEAEKKKALDKANRCV